MYCCRFFHHVLKSNVLFKFLSPYSAVYPHFHPLVQYHKYSVLCNTHLSSVILFCILPSITSIMTASISTLNDDDDDDVITLPLLAQTSTSNHSLFPLLVLTQKLYYFKTHLMLPSTSPIPFTLIIFHNLYLSPVSCFFQIF